MLIDHINFSTSLKQSTQPRGPGADGNVYFDTANNRIQLIWAHELATIDFGAGPVANPLIFADGINMRALYNFENQERRVDESLRNFKRGIDGDYRFSGAFNFINGVKLDNTGPQDDRKGIRGSGFIEYADTVGGTDKDRIYHGVKSLVSIQPSTVSSFALVTATDETTLQSATWADFSRTGEINEVIQVYGSTTYGDTGAGDFDYTTRTAVVRVRSWGYTPGETTSVASGITEFSGFSAGYGVGESLNASNTYDLADVYGGAQVAPWTGMSLEKLVTPQTETGFNEASGNFTWVLHNTGGGTVRQCAAYLDALTLQDSDIDSGAGTYNGRKGRVWYTYNAAGKVVTSSVSGAGLVVEGLSIAEKQNIIMTDDAAAAKTYPFFPDIQIDTGAIAPTDPLAWYQMIYANGAGTADYDTANAVTVQDANGVDIKGYVATDAISGVISVPYAYDTNNQAGLSAGVDKDVVVIVSGDGIADERVTYATITRSPVVPISCAPGADNNA